MDHPTNDSSSNNKNNIVYDDDNKTISALSANIKEKGRNAYYYAHHKTPQGPKWDGKVEPRLLSKKESSSSSVIIGENEKKNVRIKSNITSYGFSDEGSKIKVYIELHNHHLDDTEEDCGISLEWTERSFCLIIKGCTPSPSPPPPSDEEVVVEEKQKEQQEQAEAQELCLAIPKLYGFIDGASFRRKKKNRIIVILSKVPKQKQLLDVNQMTLTSSEEEDDDGNENGMKKKKEEDEEAAESKLEYDDWPTIQN